MRSVEELCAPEGLLPAEQLNYWRNLAQELHTLAQMAREILSPLADCDPAIRDWLEQFKRTEGRS